MSSLDLEVMEEQPGDSPTPFMSSLQEKHPHPTQLSCYITRTTPATKKIIEENLHLSAMYSGQISGIGPRYCPSIEDKVFKFKDKEPTRYLLSPKASMLIWFTPTAYQAAYPNKPKKDLLEQ